MPVEPMPSVFGRMHLTGALLYALADPRAEEAAAPAAAQKPNRFRTKLINSIKGNIARASASSGRCSSRSERSGDAAAGSGRYAPPRGLLLLLSGTRGEPSSYYPRSNWNGGPRHASGREVLWDAELNILLNFRSPHRG